MAKSVALLCILLFLSSVLPILLKGQRMNTISVDQGLNDNYNDFIYMDSLGYIWISSTNGVYKFDGIKLRQYRDDDGSGYVGQNSMSHFFQDDPKNIYFSTTHAVLKYNHDVDSFYSIPLPLIRDSLVNNTYLFHLAPDGSFWLKMGENIERFDPNTGNRMVVGASIGVRFAVSDRSNYPESIVSCPWITDKSIRIYKRQNDNTYQTYKIDLETEVSNAIFYKDYLYAIGTNLIYKIDTETLEIEHNYSPQTTSNFFRAYTSNDSLFVVDQLYGIWYFNESRSEFVSYRSSTSIEIPLLFGAYIDNNGKGWYANMQPPKITSDRLVNNDGHIQLLDKIPTDVNARSILSLSGGGFGISSRTKGVFFVDSALKNVDAFNIKTHTGNSELNTAHYYLSEDMDNRVWASGDNYLFAFNQNNKKPIEQIRLSDTISVIWNASCSDSIMALHSASSGVHLYNTKRNSLCSNLAISGDVLDVSGLYWNGNKLLFQFRDSLVVAKVEDETVLRDTTLFIKAGVRDYAFGIASGKEYIWILTKSNSFFELDMESYTIEEKSMPAFITNYVGTAICFDNHQTLWLGTTDGLISYNVTSEEIYKYNIEDGLPSGYINLNSMAIRGDGIMLCGYGGGVFAVNTNEIQSVKVEPCVHLKLLANDRLYSIKPLNVLGYNNNRIALDMTVPYFHAPEKINIEYRLRGYEEDWKIKSNASLQEYLLKPGKYVFESRAYNSNGILGPTQKLNLVITKPFWQKWWFRILIIGLLIGLIASIVRSYYKLKMRRQQRIFENERKVTEALQNERNRMATEMHDDLGGGLTSIRILAQKLRTKGHLQPSDPNIHKIEKYSVRLVENMRSLIWALNEQYDSLDELIYYYREYTAEYLEDHNLDYSIDIPQHFPDLKISGRKRRSLFLCLKEALNNVVKHANATKVIIDIKLEYDNLILMVKDDGIGIDIDSKHKGNGLRNYSKHMELLNGECEVKNRNGTEIHFSVPIDNISEIDG